MHRCTAIFTCCTKVPTPAVQVLSPAAQVSSPTVQAPTRPSYHESGREPAFIRHKERLGGIEEGDGEETRLSSSSFLPSFGSNGDPLTPPDENPGGQAAPGIRPLPVFSPMSAAGFTWGQLCASDFSQALQATYSEAATWRRNIISVPSGQARKKFVHELARLYQAFADSPAIEPVALRAAMVMPLLVLQRPLDTPSRKDLV